MKILKTCCAVHLKRVEGEFYVASAFLIKQKILSRRDWALSADIQSMRGI